MSQKENKDIVKNMSENNFVWAVHSIFLYWKTWRGFMPINILGKIIILYCGVRIHLFHNVGIVYVKSNWMP